MGVGRFCLPKRMGRAWKRHGKGKVLKRNSISQRRTKILLLSLLYLKFIRRARRKTHFYSTLRHFNLFIFIYL